MSGTPVRLTPREVQIFPLLIEGLPMKEIADRLHISPRTVKFHCEHIYHKFRVGPPSGHNKRLPLINLFGHFEVSVMWVPNK